VAAAELTGVIALLMSSSSGRLSTSSIVSLLKESVVAGTNGDVDVNGALAKLDLEQHRGRVAARAVH
jgi:hypothetical protein